MRRRPHFLFTNPILEVIIKLEHLNNCSNEQLLNGYRGIQMGADFDKCDVLSINHEAVNRVKKEMLDDDTVRDMADIFKGLGDPNRVKIIHCLAREELCVCDLAQLLRMSISAVSHQLRALRDRRLVKYRRDGKIVYYSLDDAHIVTLFKQCLDHIKHD